MKYVIIAGETSGDLHASGLIKAISRFDPQAQFRFFGGDLMARQAGHEPDVHCNEMNVMGFSEVIRKLPTILGTLRKAKDLLASYRPDALILVDYPSFNLKLAKTAHQLGIPVHYFISPKIWAWKEFRIHKIKKYVDAMYSILPFEVAYYKKHNYDVTYVGNPSVQEMDYEVAHIPPRKHFLERLGIADESPIIALLPGSRRGEIRNNLPLMIEAAKRFPQFQYIVGGAPSVPLRFYREIAQDQGLNVASGYTHVLLKHAVAAAVTSGTATLETALLGTPQVVCYRANGKKLSYKIMEKLLKVKYVSLPNLIAGNEIVPELLVHKCTADTIAHALSPLLQPSPARDWQMAGYRAIKRKLGTTIATDYAARLICTSLGISIPKDASTPTPMPEPPKRKKKKPSSSHNPDKAQES